MDSGHCGVFMARRTKRLWTDEEKRSICVQTKAPDVSVAQVARRYSMNANLIFTWLRDPRYAPDASADPYAACFLPFEIVDRPMHDDDRAAAGPVPSAGTIEIDIAGGHRPRISGAYDPEALARLIRGLSG
ncbi:IS66-like element accessory protein TnpA [Roseivivax halotolerans]|nr:transposase [Roseivivax halotolerans]